MSRRTAIALSVAVVLVGAAFGVGYYFGTRQTPAQSVGTSSSTQTAAGQTPISSTTTTTASDPNSLPIYVSSNSDAGIDPSSCQLSSNGDEVIVTGTFSPPIAPFPANENDSQMPYVLVGVFDSQGADLTVNASNEPNHFMVAAGQTSWQGTIYITTGFTPDQCDVALFNT
jgi:hypothetical protein